MSVYAESDKSRLILLYSEIKRLETDLLVQQRSERLLNKRALKASKITKYRIAVLNRNVRTIERKLNYAAEVWESWLFNANDLESSANRLADDIEVLKAEVSELVTQVAANVKDPVQTQVLGAELIAKNKALEGTKKELKTIEREIISWNKKRPQQVARVSAHSILREYIKNNNEQDLSLPGETADIAVFAGLSREEQQDRIRKNKLCAGVTPDPSDLLRKNYSNVHPDLPQDDTPITFKLVDEDYGEKSEE